jgi:NADH:ubiquinone oxidoreductase subunit 4 (subunit M)
MPLVLLSSWHSISRWKVRDHAAARDRDAGVFVALDLFLFYVFWRRAIPMYLIIGIWRPNRGTRGCSFSRWRARC